VSPVLFCLQETCDLHSCQLLPLFLDLGKDMGGGRGDLGDRGSFFHSCPRSLRNLLVFSLFLASDLWRVLSPYTPPSPSSFLPSRDVAITTPTQTVPVLLSFHFLVSPPSPPHLTSLQAHGGEWTKLLLLGRPPSASPPPSAFTVTQRQLTLPLQGFLLFLLPVALLRPTFFLCCNPCILSEMD